MYVFMLDLCDTARTDLYMYDTLAWSDIFIVIPATGVKHYYPRPTPILHPPHHFQLKFDKTRGYPCRLSSADDNNALRRNFRRKTLEFITR